MAARLDVQALVTIHADLATAFGPRLADRACCSFSGSFIEDGF
jgi:hypothetical protein